MTDYNPLFDPATDNLPIDKTVQEKVINDVKSDPEGISNEDNDFLMTVMDLVDREVINLHNPESLIKNAVYDSLSEEIQGKADFNALNLLSTLRQIRTLWDLDKRDSFQIKNLIHQVRMTKERVEAECGDVYII